MTTKALVLGVADLIVGTSAGATVAALWHQP